MRDRVGGGLTDEGGICMPKRTHIFVQQKLTQHYEAIIP